MAMKRWFMRIMSDKSRRDAGFTLVELIIVLLVSGILAGLLFGPLNDLFYSSSAGLATVIRDSDNRDALQNIQQSVSLSTEFLESSTLQGTINGPISGDGTPWSFNSAAGSDSGQFPLITRNHTTTELSTSDEDGSRSMLYQSNCIDPLMGETVFFVKDKKLYQRYLRGTPASVCINGSVTAVPSPLPGSSPLIAQKRSCVMAIPDCERRDSVIVQNVEAFTVQYFSSPSSSTPLPSPTGAKTVSIKLTTFTGIGTNKKTSTSEVRITRVNGS